MNMIAFRQTELGIRERRIHKDADAIVAARARRMAAQRAAMDARMVEEQARIVRKQAAIEDSLAKMSELRANGIRFRPTYHTIEARTLALFGLSRSELRSNRRHRELVFARQFLMYWAVRLTGLSLPQIGRMMGGRDHTTVLHGKRRYPEKRAKMGRYLRQTR